MKLGCADNTFRLVEPWENAVGMIKLLDLEGVDVCVMGDRSHIRPEDIRGAIPRAAKRVRAGVEEQGLEISDVFCIPWTEFVTMSPNHPSSTERQEARALFDDMLELVVETGSPGLTMLPGIDWEDETHDKSFGRAVEELGWRAEQARAAGIRFSIEPHLGSVVQDPREAKRLCEDSQGVELTLDYSHFVYQGYPESEIEPLIQHARHFHVRGAAKARMQIALKDSVIDFERMIDVAQETGYDGDIGLEWLWIDWERLNECDTVSETILLRDRIRAKLAGETWEYPKSTI